MNVAAKWVIAMAMLAMGSSSLAQDTQYDVSGTFVQGGSFSGDLFVDSTAGSLDSAMITVSGLSGGLLANLNAVYTLYSNPGTTGCNAGTCTIELMGQDIRVGGAATFLSYAGSTSYTPYAPTLSAYDSSLGISGGYFAQGSGSIIAAPEIDPASAASGLTLILASLMVLRGRHARK